MAVFQNLAAPLTPLCGTLVCRGTPVGNHCFKGLFVNDAFLIGENYYINGTKVHFKALGIEKLKAFMIQLCLYKTVHSYTTFGFTNIFTFLSFVML